MIRNLAMQYAKYDNKLNEYFDHVLLDQVSDEFREGYYQIRNDILTEILEDNKCCIQDGFDILYTKHNDYDDLMIRLIEHYNTVKSNASDSFEQYQVELLMIEHYMELCGYTKDELGYWKEIYGRN